MSYTRRSFIKKSSMTALVAANAALLTGVVDASSIYHYSFTENECADLYSDDEMNYKSHTYYQVAGTHNCDVTYTCPDGSECTGTVECSIVDTIDGKTRCADYDLIA